MGADLSSSSASGLSGSEDEMMWSSSSSLLRGLAVAVALATGPSTMSPLQGAASMTLVTLLVALPPVGAAPPPDYANRPFDYAHDAEGSGTGQNGCKPRSRTNAWQASISSPPFLDVTSRALDHKRNAPNLNRVGAASLPLAATLPQTSTSSSSESDSESDK